MAKARGLDGIAITDHDTIEGHAEAKKLSGRDFVIIPGVEISSADGHILGLGVSKLMPRGLSAEETVKRIRGQGGIAVAAHPFAFGRRPGVVHKARFDAIEVFNSRALFLANPLAREFAEKNHLPVTAGSDAHYCDEIGLASVTLNCKANVGSILKEIKGGRASISGRTLPLWSYLRGALHRIIHRRWRT